MLECSHIVSAVLGGWATALLPGYSSVCFPMTLVKTRVREKLALDKFQVNFHVFNSAGDVC